MFSKNFSDTALHVYWTGTLRTYASNGCKRWYFTFNGTECSAPLPIDGVVYVHSTTVNPIRVRHIEGYCNNIHKGKPCAWDSGLVNAKGTMETMTPTQDIVLCPASS